MPPRIFISYSHQDSDYAEALAEALEEVGFSAWIDDAIDYGERWFTTITQAIRECVAVTVIMTPEAEQSEWVEREILIAQREKKPILPLLLRGKEFALLITMQYVDVTDSEMPPRRFYQMLEKAVQQSRGEVVEEPIHHPPKKARKPKVTPLLAPDPAAQSERIRVLVADDHRLIRAGLIVLLENFEEFEFVGEAADGATALKLCERLRPDVVLMDITMPIMDGIEATARIHERYPEIKVLMMTSLGDEDYIQRAFKAGAAGYLMKNVSLEELAQAIREVYQGQPILAPEVTRLLIQATIRSPAIGHDFSERELEVTALMAEGLTNREIGERLGMSSSVVKNHVTSILAKLGTTSRIQAVAIAVERKIIKALS